MAEEITSIQSNYSSDQAQEARKKKEIEKPPPPKAPESKVKPQESGLEGKAGKPGESAHFSREASTSAAREKKAGGTLDDFRNGVLGLLGNGADTPGPRKEPAASGAREGPGPCKSVQV